MLSLSLPVLVVLAIVLAAAFHILEKPSRNLLGQSEARQLDVRSALIGNRLKTAAADLLLIADGSAMAAWASSPGPRRLPALKRDLYEMMEYKTFYHQARLLDADGMELLRIESIPPGYTIVKSDEDLQNKATRSYFHKAMKLGKHGIYISRLDLNVERGQIETPFRPTLRLATPIIDAFGTRKGVLVFNLHGSQLLEEGTALHGDQSGWEFLLTNQNGYWLVGPTPEDEWGFQIPSRATRTLGGRYPRAWESIRFQQSGRVFTEKGLFLFSSIIPAHILEDRTTEIEDQNLPFSAEKARWIILAHLPQEQVSLYLRSGAFPLTLAFGLSACIILVYGFVLALAHERLKRAQTNEANQARELGETVDRLQELARINDQTMEQLRDANARFKSVLRAANQVSVIATDTEGTITLFNHGAENLLGYTAEEMVGKQTPEILHSRDEVVERGRHLTAKLGYEVAGFDVFVETARHGGFESRDWTYVRKDGSELSVELVVTAITDEEDINGFLGIAVDVTERNKAQLALEESKARLESIVDAAVDGIFTVDTTGVIRSVNQAGAAIFGYAPEELAGNKINMIMDEPDRSRHDHYMQRYLKTGEQTIIGVGGREVMGRHRNGTPLPLELGISEVNTRTARFFTGILRDISKRKKAEAALQDANNALKAKQHALDEDLIAAAQIQHGLLPRKPPMLADSPSTGFSSRARISAATSSTCSPCRAASSASTSST